MTMDMTYFETLRSKINERLIKLVREGKYDEHSAKRQIEDFPWLYGALGKVPSDVMFICENPSLAGIKKANIDTIDSGPPDIEAQWWGGSTDFAACRFRVALCKLKLKTSPPAARGGWECYITNVIKQSEKVIEREKLKPINKRQQARDWSDILLWELVNVKPSYVFCVGVNSFKYVRMLQKEEFIPWFPMVEITHYSARKSTLAIIDEITSVVFKTIKTKKITKTKVHNLEPKKKGDTMNDLITELKKLDGQKCYTLTRDNPATMRLTDTGVTIIYPTGGKTQIPMAMIQEAWKKLHIKGMLSLEDVHQGITKENGPRTDRLMAIFRNLPGVGFTREPRTLFLKKQE